MRDEAKIEIMSMIWYLIATSGSEPPSICPVIVPGRAMSPITAIEAIVGLKLLMRASRINGERVFDRLSLDVCSNFWCNV